MSGYSLASVIPKMKRVFLPSITKVIPSHFAPLTQLRS
jgi:hypothetical protein